MERGKKKRKKKSATTTQRRDNIIASRWMLHALDTLNFIFYSSRTKNEPLSTTINTAVITTSLVKLQQGSKERKREKKTATKEQHNKHSGGCWYCSETERDWNETRKTRGGGTRRGETRRGEVSFVWFLIWIRRSDSPVHHWKACLLYYTSINIYTFNQK